MGISISNKFAGVMGNSVLSNLPPTRNATGYLLGVDVVGYYTSSTVLVIIYSR